MTKSEGKKSNKLYEWEGKLLRDDKHKVFYNAIQIREGKKINIYNIGDIVYFQSSSSVPYIAEIDSFYEDKSTGLKHVTAKWFYRVRDAQEISATAFGTLDKNIHYDILCSDGKDDNDVQSILQHCQVIFCEDIKSSVADLIQGRKDTFICRYKIIPSQKRIEKLKAKEVAALKARCNRSQIDSYVSDATSSSSSPLKGRNKKERDTIDWTLYMEPRKSSRLHKLDEPGNGHQAQTDNSIETSIKFVNAGESDLHFDHNGNSSSMSGPSKNNNTSSSHLKDASLEMVAVENGIEGGISSTHKRKNSEADSEETEHKERSSKQSANLEFLVVNRANNRAERFEPDAGQHSIGNSKTNRPVGRPRSNNLTINMKENNNLNPENNVIDVTKSFNETTIPTFLSNATGITNSNQSNRTSTGRPQRRTTTEPINSIANKQNNQIAEISSGQSNSHSRAETSSTLNVPLDQKTQCNEIVGNKPTRRGLHTKRSSSNLCPSKVAADEESKAQSVDMKSPKKSHFNSQLSKSNPDSNETIDNNEVVIEIEDPESPRTREYNYFLRNKLGIGVDKYVPPKIGINHQIDIPAFVTDYVDGNTLGFDSTTESTLVWKPDAVTDEELSLYLAAVDDAFVSEHEKFVTRRDKDATTPCSNGQIFVNGSYLLIKSYVEGMAYDILHQCEYRSDEAVDLISAVFDEGVDEWTHEEQTAFRSAFAKYGDNLKKIAVSFPNRSRLDIVEYFYRCIYSAAQLENIDVSTIPWNAGDFLDVTGGSVSQSTTDPRDPESDHDDESSSENDEDDDYRFSNADTYDRDNLQDYDDDRNHDNNQPHRRREELGSSFNHGSGIETKISNSTNNKQSNHGEFNSEQQSSEDYHDCLQENDTLSQVSANNSRHTLIKDSRGRFSKTKLPNRIDSVGGLLTADSTANASESSDCDIEPPDNPTSNVRLSSSTAVSNERAIEFILTLREKLSDPDFSQALSTFILFEAHDITPAQLVVRLHSLIERSLDHNPVFLSPLNDRYQFKRSDKLAIYKQFLGMIPSELIPLLSRLFSHNSLV